MHFGTIINIDQLDNSSGDIAKQEFTNELAQSDLLKGLPEAVLEMIVSPGKVIELQSGQLLLSPEIENNHVYILLSGTLGVHFGSLSSPEIRVLEKGACVGEMSMIEQSKPSAFIVAREACQVMPVQSSILQQYVLNVNPVVRNLLHVLTRWIRENTECMVHNTSKIGELTNDAATDALTGLYNRRWLDNSLTHFLTEAAENSQTLCLLLLDADNFKNYNDTFGHSAGDHALKIISKTLRHAIRPQDFACRYGGEEFLILLPHTNINEGRLVAERIRHAIEDISIFAQNGTEMSKLTISIGLSKSHFYSTPKSLIDSADAKLYQAKQEGRNCIRF